MEDSGAALRERQRRWFIERARFEAADRAARAASAEANASSAGD